MSTIDCSNVDAVAIRLSAMGDVVLTTGVLDYWHKKHGLTFAFVTRKSLAPLFENNPAVPTVIGLSEETIQNNWWNAAKALAKHCGKLPLFDLHGTTRSALLRLQWKGKVHAYPKFTISRRLFKMMQPAFASRRLRQFNVPQRYALAYESEAPSPDQLVPRIYLTEAEREQARTTIKKAGITRPFVALHPYATHMNKQWPEHRWIELVTEIEKAGLEWIVVGHDTNTFLAPANARRDMTSKTTLRQVCALLAEAECLVTGDSGPMHLGTAVGTPVISLFGPTTREWGFFPAGPKDTVQERDLPCRPCSLHGGKACTRSRECLATITAVEVAEQIRQAVDIS